MSQGRENQKMKHSKTRKGSQSRAFGTKKDNRKRKMSEDEKEEETTTGKKLERDNTQSEAAGGMEVDKEDERQESGDDEETNTDMEYVQQQENTPTKKVISSRTPGGEYNDSGNDVHHGKEKHTKRTARPNGRVYLARQINANLTSHDRKVKPNSLVKTVSRTRPTHLLSPDGLADQMKQTKPDR